MLGLEELNTSKRNERLIKFLDTNLFYLMLIRLKHNWICVSYIPGNPCQGSTHQSRSDLGPSGAVLTMLSTEPCTKQHLDNLRDPVTKRIRELEKINEVVKAFGKEPLEKERSSTEKI